MYKHSVDKIIRSFFGKHLSENSRRLFGQWLGNKELQTEKDEVLSELWEESPAVITSSTQEDWEDLRRHIQPATPARNVSFYRSWMRYAAVMLLLLATGISSYYLTLRHVPLKTPELMEFFVPYGESRSAELPDGSRVWVNAGSLLIYPHQFAGNNRSVFLSGEATFQVTHDADHPFFVKTNHLDVEVLGTLFTVKAYPNDYFTTATLEEGSVSVDIKTGQLGKSFLTPHEQLVFSHEDQSVSIQKIDMDLYRMERKGFLIFENATFRQLITSLERKYNVVIHYNAQGYEDHKYNIKFSPDETIEEAMNVLRQLTGLRYKIEGEVIFIN